MKRNIALENPGDTIKTLGDGYANEKALEEIVFDIVRLLEFHMGLDHQGKALKVAINNLFNPYLRERLDLNSVEQIIHKLDVAEEIKVLLRSLLKMVNQLIDFRTKDMVVKITRPEDVYRDFFHMKFHSNEIMKALYLSLKNELVSSKDISFGDSKSVMVNPLVIFESAIKNDCKHFILVHNHPSGLVVPSEEDIKFTRRIEDSSKILGLKFIDHIIIGDSFYSFKKNQLL